MDKRNEIELLQAQLIQERALVQDLEAGKSKMILDAIEVGGQFLDLCEAVRVLKEVLQLIMLKAPGYDWNTDPLSITLMVGNAVTKSDHVLAGEPDEENDSLQAQLAQRTAELEALRKWRDYVTVALQRPGGAFFEDVPKHIIDLVAELERVRAQVQQLEKDNATLHQFWMNADDWLAYNDKQAAIQRERDILRTLVAALPKVEGAVEVSAGDDGCYILPLWIRCVTKEQADGIAALLQERQKLC